MSIPGDFDCVRVYLIWLHGFVCVCVCFRDMIRYFLRQFLCEICIFHCSKNTDIMYSFTNTPEIPQILNI